MKLLTAVYSSILKLWYKELSTNCDRSDKESFCCMTMLDHTPHVLHWKLWTKSHTSLKNTYAGGKSTLQEKTKGMGWKTTNSTTQHSNHSNKTMQFEHQTNSNLSHIVDITRLSQDHSGRSIACQTFTANETNILSYGSSYKASRARPDRVKQSFVISDIQALWRSALTSECPDVKKLQTMA